MLGNSNNKDWYSPAGRADHRRSLGSPAAVDCHPSPVTNAAASLAKNAAAPVISTELAMWSSGVRSRMNARTWSFASRSAVRSVLTWPGAGVFTRTPGPVEREALAQPDQLADAGHVHHHPPVVEVGSRGPVTGEYAPEVGRDGCVDGVGLE